MSFVWRDGALVPETTLMAEATDAELVVADSWLVDDGMVGGLDGHESRFTRACQAQRGIPVDVTVAFLVAARSVIPASGRWFPRVELDARDAFRLRLRGAPSFPAAARVLARPVPDPREQPKIKGPDLALLTELRRNALALGADEALLVAPDGSVLEATLSSVVWWRGDVLCLPPPRLPILPSITRASILRIAADSKVRVRYDLCTVEDIRDCEVWLLSSLRGIWPVAEWVSGSEASHGRPLPCAPGRAETWQHMLRSRAEPMRADYACDMAG